MWIFDTKIESLCGRRNRHTFVEDPEKKMTNRESKSPTSCNQSSPFLIFSEIFFKSFITSLANMGYSHEIFELFLDASE